MEQRHFGHLLGHQRLSAPAPAVSPDGGSFATPQTVTISSIPTGAFATTTEATPEDNYQQPRTAAQGPYVGAVGNGRGRQLNLAHGWGSVTLANF